MKGNKALKDVQRLPQVIADRCVHSQLETANCRKCVDVCPNQAWVITDEALGIDEAACQGCQLCAAVCSERAISFPQTHAIFERHGVPCVCFSCSRTSRIESAGSIACIGSVGLFSLVNLYRQGVRQLYVCTEDCSSCSNRGGTEFYGNFENFNALLRQRKLQPLSLSSLSPVQMDAAMDCSDSKADTGPDVGRRSFVRKLVGQTIEATLELSGRFDDEDNASQTVGQLLPRQNPGNMAFYAISIDSHNCNGCDACIRICPHNAISLNEPEKSYQFEADHCTGCGLCEDVCDQKAVHISRWQRQQENQIALWYSRCTACGVVFHLPAAQSELSLYCPICQLHRHSEHLYQVLPDS